MSEITRIYTIRVTEIIKGEAEPKEKAAESLKGCIKNIFGADDVVELDVQDFEMGGEKCKSI